MAKKGQKFKKYSFELKKEVVEDYLKGMGKFELMKKYDVLSSTQISKWIRDYKAKGYEGLKSMKRGRPKKNKEQNEIEQLRMENEILKKIRDLLEQEKP